MITWHNVTSTTEPVAEHDGHAVTVVSKQSPPQGQAHFEVLCLADGLTFQSWQEELRWA